MSVVELRIARLQHIISKKSLDPNSDRPKIQSTVHLFQGLYATFRGN